MTRTTEHIVSMDGCGIEGVSYQLLTYFCHMVTCIVGHTYYISGHALTGSSWYSGTVIALQTQYCWILSSVGSFSA